MSNFLEKYKSVYDVFIDNWSYQSHFVAYLESLMRKETLLPLHIKEMIFAYVSGLNNCQYCKNIHAEISKKLLRDHVDLDPSSDIELSNIEEQFKPVLKFSHKVNESIDRITEEDVKVVLDFGFPENVITEIISICSAAQFMNTIVKAHSIQPLNDNMNIASAKVMIEKGYSGLAEYMINRRKK